MITDNKNKEFCSVVSDAYDYGSEESDYHLITQVYKEIGQFTRDVTLNVEEASDKGTYAPYFQNLEDYWRL